MFSQTDLRVSEVKEEVYLAVETLGTRSRLAATVASFKADVGGAEGRAV